MVVFNFYKWTKIAFFFAIIAGLVTSIILMFGFNTKPSLADPSTEVHLVEGWAIFAGLYAVIFTSYVFWINVARTDPIGFIQFWVIWDLIKIFI